MTVIAYKDRTLAGDSAWTDRGAIVTLRTKLTRLASGVLVGAAGDGDDRALMKLLADVKTPEDLPSLDALRALRCDVRLLVVFPDGQVWRVDSGKKDGGAEPTSEPCAIGTGADLAMGAMLAGKGAADAAAIAASRDTGCREPITTMSLDANGNK